MLEKKTLNFFIFFEKTAKKEKNTVSSSLLKKKVTYNCRDVISNTLLPFYLLITIYYVK